MTDIYSLGIKVDSSDVSRGSDELDDFAGAARRADDAVDDFQSTTRNGSTPVRKLGTEIETTSKKTSTMGRSAGQAGIQIQQMVGQVQGGVSPFVALSQQAADLGIVLGAPLVGVVVSLGAVLVGTLVAAFNKTGESAEDLYERINDLSDGFKELDANQKAFIALETRKQIEEKQEVMAKLADEIEKVESQLAEATKRQRGFNSNNRNYRNGAKAIERQTEELIKLKAQFSSTSQEVDNLNKKIETLGTPEASGGSSATPKAQREQTPWWGGDEAVEAEAFAIRMQLWKDEQQMIADDLAARRDATASYYEEYANSRIASAQYAAEREIQIAEEQAKQEREIEDQKIRDAEDAERKKQENIMKINRSFDTIFTNMMESQNKKIFELGRLGSASKATADAYASINATLAQGGAFAWQAALATGAAAFTNVAKIMSTKFGQTGGSAGSAPSLPEPRALNDQGVTNNSQVTVNIAGNASQSIVDQLRDIFNSDQVLIPRNSAQARELNYG